MFTILTSSSESGFHIRHECVRLIHEWHPDLVYKQIDHKCDPVTAESSLLGTAGVQWPENQRSPLWNRCSFVFGRVHNSLHPNASYVLVSYNIRQYRKCMPRNSTSVRGCFCSNFVNICPDFISICRFDDFLNDRFCTNG